MTILTDRFQVIHVPSVIIEVSLAYPTDKRADFMVYLVARRDPAFLQAFLTQAAVTLQHSFPYWPPAWIVIDQRVAAVVVSGGVLGLRLRTVDSGH